MTRYRAIRDLALLNTEAATAVLVRFAQAPCTPAGLDAVRALAHLGHPAALLWLLDSLRNEMRLSMLDELLARQGPAAVPSLIAALLLQSLGIRSVAATALGRIADPRAADSLIHALQDDDPTVALAAAGAVSRIDDPRARAATGAAVTRVLALLESSEHRRHAAEVLGCLRCPSAIPALLRAVEDPDRGVHRAVVFALARIGGPEARLGLYRCLEAPDPNRRLNVLKALKLTGPDEYRAAAEQLLLHDRTPAVRQEAAWALRSLGAAGSEAVLEAALRDPVFFVGDAAAAALKSIPDE